MAEKDVWIVKVGCRFGNCVDKGCIMYRFYFGEKPERTTKRRWPLRRQHESVCTDLVERILPRRLLPKLTGPAVKVEFK